MRQTLRFFLFLMIVFFLPFFLSFNVFASDEFETKQTVRYQVFPSGLTHVKQEISLTNKLSKVYATQYSLKLNDLVIENFKASDQEGPLRVEIEKQNRETIIKLFFNQEVVGKGSQLTFNLDYDVLNLAQKTGQVWEMTVPKIAQPEEINDYSLVLEVDKDFGEPAYLSPQPLKQTTDQNSFYYHFGKKQLVESGVSAAFGAFQIFDFLFSYHLKNPGLTSSMAQIALPPDTAFQKVYYEKIDPEPLRVVLDQDGNWLAEYRLNGGEALEINAAGKVKIFAFPQENYPHQTDEQIKENLQADTYWPVDHPKIKKVAGFLRSSEEIYDYLLETLSYDYSRVQEKVERKGALDALAHPQKAICMEYTDLFVTLARAAGIPAREVNGFAYTTNPKLQPLNLITDVLHSWPEYYDDQKSQWIPVDPTWGKTTGGVDYFHKFDMNHFAFVFHGHDSEIPYPVGSYRASGSTGKDVQIIFGQYEPEESPQIEVDYQPEKEILGWFKNQGQLIIKNQGSSALYNLPVKIKTGRLSLDSESLENIEVFLPYSERKIPVQLTTSPLSFSQNTLTVEILNQFYSFPMDQNSLSFQKITLLIPCLIILTFLILFVKNRAGRFLVKKQKQ